MVEVQEWERICESSEVISERDSQIVKFSLSEVIEGEIDIHGRMTVKQVMDILERRGNRDIQRLLDKYTIEELNLSTMAGGPIVVAQVSKSSHS